MAGKQRSLKALLHCSTGDAQKHVGKLSEDYQRHLSWLHDRLRTSKCYALDLFPVGIPIEANIGSTSEYSLDMPASVVSFAEGACPNAHSNYKEALDGGVEVKVKSECDGANSGVQTQIKELLQLFDTAGEMKVVELRAELRRLDCVAAGRKAELISRLKEDITARVEELGSKLVTSAVKKEVPPRQSLGAKEQVISKRREEEQGRQEQLQHHQKEELEKPLSEAETRMEDDVTASGDSMSSETPEGKEQMSVGNRQGNARVRASPILKHSLSAFGPAAGDGSPVSMIVVTDNVEPAPMEVDEPPRGTHASLALDTLLPLACVESGGAVSTKDVVDRKRASGRDSYAHELSSRIVKPPVRRQISPLLAEDCKGGERLRRSSYTPSSHKKKAESKPKVECAEAALDSVGGSNSGKMRWPSIVPTSNPVELAILSPMRTAGATAVSSGSTQAEVLQGVRKIMPASELVCRMEESVRLSGSAYVYERNENAHAEFATAPASVRKAPSPSVSAAGSSSSAQKRPAEDSDNDQHKRQKGNSTDAGNLHKTLTSIVKGMTTQSRIALALGNEVPPAPFSPAKSVVPISFSIPPTPAVGPAVDSSVMEQASGNDVHEKALSSGNFSTRTKLQSAAAAPVVTASEVDGVRKPTNLVSGLHSFTALSRSLVSSSGLANSGPCSKPLPASGAHKVVVPALVMAQRAKLEAERRAKLDMERREEERRAAAAAKEKVHLGGRKGLELAKVSKPLQEQRNKIDVLRITTKPVAVPPASRRPQPPAGKPNELPSGGNGQSSPEDTELKIQRKRENIAKQKYEREVKEQNEKTTGSEEQDLHGRSEQESRGDNKGEEAKEQEIKGPQTAEGKRGNHEGGATARDRTEEEVVLPITTGANKKQHVSNDNYDMSDRGSSSEEESEDSGAENTERQKKHVPSWAKGELLKQALQAQYYGAGAADPDGIFPDVETCDLEAIFQTGKRKYMRRGSSANWVHDRPLPYEELAHKRTAGIKALTQR